MSGSVHRVLLGASAIQQRVEELASEILSSLGEKGKGEPPPLTIVAVMMGSLVFLADLIRHLPLQTSIRLVTLSSYPGPATTSHGVRVQGALPEDLARKHVLLLDDILDTGRTLAFLQKHLMEQHPASLTTCVLLRKERAREMAVAVEHVGFKIPDLFVVGYGLDHNGEYRNLPEIRVIEGLRLEA